MPASTKAVRMWFGAMSAGDAKKFDTEFKRLGVDYVDENGVLSTKQAINPEQQTQLMSLAVELGNIDYGAAIMHNSECTVHNEGQSAAAKASQYVKQAQAALLEAVRELGV